MDSPRNPSESHDSEPHDDRPEDEFQRLLRQMLSGDGEGLAKATGLPVDPAAIASILASVQHAATSDEIDWAPARERAVQVARAQEVALTDDDREHARRAFDIARLWLGEATALETAAADRVMSRSEWASSSMPFWQTLCEPVAGSVARALTDALQRNLPDELQPMMTQAAGMMRAMATGVFVVQLGQVVGQLAGETVSADEIGLPVVSGAPALLPQNVHAFSQGLEVPVEEIVIFLAARELAHAALFRHAPWLTSDLTSAITAYARGIEIDATRIETLGRGIDPTDAEALRRVIEGGELIPPRTQEQEAALARIETLLALVEGWVDTVTQTAVQRLPHRAAIAETVIRRRALGGPAEHAFGTLVGLEFRPRQLRLAATLWRTVTDELGADERDALWRHPDLLPTADDLADPAAFVAHARGDEETDFDRDLARLLDGDLPASPRPKGPDDPDDAGDDATGDPGSPRA